MYWQVYLHHTSVAAEQVLIKILTRAKQLVESGVELFASPALKYFLAPQQSPSSAITHTLLTHYAALDDSDLLSAIKTWMNSEDKVLNVLCECFTHRQLFKSKLLDEPLSIEEKEALREQYAKRFGVTKEDADYFFVEHISTSNTYSEKGEAIDIMYKDGSVRDIAEASEMLNMETLTYKPQKIYLFHLK
jgi:HD superfamily phosphohydrolase